MLHHYIYPFVENPGDMPVSAPIYKAMEKLIAGGKLTTGTDDGWDGFKHKSPNGNYIQKSGYDRSKNDYSLFSEIGHPEAYQQGIYRLAGYAFNFRPFFKRYLVKTKDCGWREQYAPNKTFIRKCAAFPREIIEILDYPVKA